MTMGVVGLVQARMASQRLPGKVMLDLAGRPMIDHIFERLARVRGLDGLCLATTCDPRNDGLAEFASTRGVSVWREADENDIAARLRNAADMAGRKSILKVNADCPLIDPDVLQLLVDRFANGDVSYVSNKIVWTWPKGLSAEVIAWPALEWCARNLQTAHDREYVADWIKNCPDRFPSASIESSLDLGHLDWMVDTPEDLERMRRLFAALSRPGECFGLSAVLDYCKAEVAACRIL